MRENMLGMYTFCTYQLFYVDQLTTGSQAHINCGPTSIEMASKWKNKDYTLKAQDIRKNKAYRFWSACFNFIYLDALSGSLNFIVFSICFNMSSFLGSTKRQV